MSRSHELRRRLVSFQPNCHSIPNHTKPKTKNHNRKARLGECDKATSFKILDTFYENGGNFIDTANNYQNEDSEAWLGEWMEARGVRDEIVLATKYTSPYRLHNKSQIQANYVGNNAKSLKVSVEASLRKMKTDYIDLVRFLNYAIGRIGD